MYKTNNNRQLELTDFNQPIGLTMDPNNRWVRLAAVIPWEKYEHKYARLFIGSKVGNVAKPFRMALGSLIIQQKLGFSDRELVEEITENPYLQYFIGLPGYQQERPFEPRTMTNHKDDHHSDGGSGTADEPKSEKPVANRGTLILDATCAPSNIRYPQDFSLLNEAREKLEKIIRRFHAEYGLELPRMYNRIARKKYLNLAKSKKRSQQKIRRVVRYMLNCIRRDNGYLENFMSEGYAPYSNEIRQISTIRKLYEQQLEMYQNRTRRVDDRIVSIQQPYIRPIVRGKTKAPVEFGTKFDLSIDEHGMGRIEKISFDPYNESGTLQDACERCRERTGHYPERVLEDQIHRNRKNRRYCREHGIRMSGPKLRRPSTEPMSREERRIEYADNTDRIEVERSFSLSKRCYSLGLIRTKTEITTFSAISLSILTTNLFRILARMGRYIFVFVKVLFMSGMTRHENGIYWAIAC